MFMRDINYGIVRCIKRCIRFVDIHDPNMLSNSICKVYCHIGIKDHSAMFKFYIVFIYRNRKGITR